MSFEAPETPNQDIKLPEEETLHVEQDAEPSAEGSREDKSREQEVQRILEESQEFLDNEERYGETRREAAVVFLKEKHPDLEPGTEQYSEAWSRLVQGITYNQFKSSVYFVEHPEITFDQYQGDRDHLDVYSDFARRVESAKKETMDQSSFSVRVQGEEGWESITVDMDNLDSLDAATKERFLTGLRGEKERGIGAGELSMLVEKGLIKPDEVGDYLKNNGNIRPDRGTLDVFSPSAIKKLQQDPAWSNRILQEVEADAGKLKSAGKNDPDLAAVYSAQILRADVGSPDVQGRLLKYYIHNEDLKMALTRQIEQSSQHNVPVTGDRFSPRDLGAFAEAGIISHDELIEIAKRNVEWYKSKGVEGNADKSSEDYLRRGNRAHLLGEAVGQTYVYKRLGLISQAELDQILDY